MRNIGKWLLGLGIVGAFNFVDAGHRFIDLKSSMQEVSSYKGADSSLDRSLAFMRSGNSSVAIPEAHAVFFRSANILEVLDAVLVARSWKDRREVGWTVKYQLYELLSCAYFYGHGSSQDLPMALEYLTKIEERCRAGLASVFARQLMGKGELYCAMQFAAHARSADSSYVQSQIDALSPDRCYEVANQWKEFGFSDRKNAVLLFERAGRLGNARLARKLRIQQAYFALEQADVSAALRKLREALAISFDHTVPGEVVDDREADERTVRNAIEALTL